jgi:hypothetical protein
MKLMRFTSSLLALILAMACVPIADALQGPPPPPPAVQGYGPPPPPPRPGWDAPPGSYRSDIERRAYHEGIYGAQKDRQNGRVPNVNNRDEYMRKTAFPVPPNMLNSYRHAFRAGYNRGVQIYYGPRRY